MKQLYTGVYKFMGSIGKEIKSVSGTPNVTINKNHYVSCKKGFRG